MYTTHQLRTLWFEFWNSKQHSIIPSASILPSDDPSALFHNSGMHPLVPYLNGKPHINGKRLANAQKCIRTKDIEEVGDATHLTFFEMLGNWSLGDYFKNEQIRYCYEFLFDVLKLDKTRVAVSVFKGDNNAPMDTESASLWEELGIEKNRIAYLPADNNWWAKGDYGLCGPDTEMFYWADNDTPAPYSFQETADDERWVEIWNSVFMTFDKLKTGELVPLQNKNIDTGMGLERTVAVLNGYRSVYQTNAFTALLTHIATLSHKEYLLDNVIDSTKEHYAMRVLADHIRTMCIMIADGVVPSNTEQGYILRRIMRRAMRFSRKLNMHHISLSVFTDTVINDLGAIYKELIVNNEHIKQVIIKEETAFLGALERGEKEFMKMIGESIITGKDAFYLYETYGYPLELTEEMALEYGMDIDKDGFYEAQKAHKQLSKDTSMGKFKGGLNDNNEDTIALHTATHLLQAGLRKHLGEHIQQKGQHINEERTRFDFTHNSALTDAQIVLVEQYVNDAINDNAAIIMEEMSVDDAYKEGALGWFKDTYGDIVKVYTMGKWSKEICGGPHLDSTGAVNGVFKIDKQESVGAGIRRIKGIIIPL